MPTVSVHPNPTFDPLRVRVLLFDIDGTLSDSDNEMVEAVWSYTRWLTVLVMEPVVWRFARWLVRFAEGPGNWLLNQADKFGIDHHLANFLDKRADHSSGLPEDFPVIPGVRHMLDVLSPHYPMAVVSARNEATTRLFLSINGLEKYFQVIVTSQTCSRTKPFPDPLLHAAKLLGVPIESCLMVGDTVTDVRAALAAGAQSLSVLCGFGTEKDLLRAGTNALVSSTSALSDYLAETAINL